MYRATSSTRSGLSTLEKTLHPSALNRSCSCICNGRSCLPGALSSTKNISPPGKTTNLSGTPECPGLMNLYAMPPTASTVRTNSFSTSRSIMLLLSCCASTLRGVAASSLRASLVSRRDVTASRQSVRAEPNRLRLVLIPDERP